MQIDYFYYLQFNNHKIVQYENKNLPYMSIADNIIMLTANMTLEEHCHHTQDRILFVQIFFSHYARRDKKRGNKEKYRNEK